jgi:hypothetical protein
MSISFNPISQGSYTNLATEFYAYAEHLSVEKINASSRGIVDLLKTADLLKPELISLLVCGDPVIDEVTLQTLQYLHEAKLVHRDTEKNLALVFGHGKDRNDVLLAIRVLSEKGLLKQENLDLFTIDSQVGVGVNAMAKAGCLTQEYLDRVITYAWEAGFFITDFAKFMSYMEKTEDGITQERLNGWFRDCPQASWTSSMDYCEKYLTYGWKQNWDFISWYTLGGTLALMRQHGLLTVEYRRALLAKPTDDYVAKPLFQSLHAAIDGISKGTKPIASQDMKV